MLNLDRTVLRPGFARFMLFVAAGSLLAMLVTVWISLCGTSPASLTAFGIGITLGAIGYEWAAPFVFASGQATTKSMRTIRLSLFMAQLTIVWLTPLLLNSTLLAGCETFGTSGSARTLLCLMFPASVVALNMAIGSLLLRCLHGPTSGRVVMSLPAVALGAMLMLIHGWFVFPLAATVTVCLFAAAVLCEISTTADTLTDERSETSVANENSAARWISIAMMFGSTLLLIGSVNLIGQLIQLNLPIVFMSSFLAALIITGMMFGIMRRKVAPAADWWRPLRFWPCFRMPLVC